MSGQISNQFKNTLVDQSVSAIYNRLNDFYPNRVDGPGGIEISDAVQRRLPNLDANHDGRLSRTELRRAMTEDRVVISLENAGESDPGRKALANDMARNVINFVDQEDGILGGQIRVSGNMIDSSEATRRLTNGQWAFGKVLGDAAALQRAGYQVIELHENARGPKTTNP